MISLLSRSLIPDAAFPRTLFPRYSIHSLRPKKLTKELALDFHRSMDLRTGQAAQCLSTANYNVEPLSRYICPKVVSLLSNHTWAIELNLGENVPARSSC